MICCQLCFINLILSRTRCAGYGEGILPALSRTIISKLVAHQDANKTGGMRASIHAQLSSICSSYLRIGLVRKASEAMPQCCIAARDHEQQVSGEKSANRQVESSQHTLLILTWDIRLHVRKIVPEN